MKIDISDLYKVVVNDESHRLVLYTKNADDISKVKAMVEGFRSALGLPQTVKVDVYRGITGEFEEVKDVWLNW